MSLRLPRALRTGILGLVTALIAALLTFAGFVGPTPAHAAAAPATSDPVYHAVSGGSRIQVAGAVQSGLTAASSLRVENAPRTVDNKTADANVLKGVLEAEAIQTRNSTKKVLGGVEVTSYSRIAGVSLLDGLITAKAIETTATATIRGDDVSRKGRTKFVGVKVGDTNIPLNVPKNTGITIPGVIKVVVNEVRGQIGGDALIKSQATGLRITLLESRDGLRQGASIELTPTMARILLPVPIDGEPAFGYAYSSRVAAHVGDEVNVMSAPTSIVICPAGGTSGVPLENAAARAVLPGIVQARGLGNYADATVTSRKTVAKMQAKIGAVDLLGGLITLDAVTSTARVVKVKGKKTRKTGNAKIVGLTIAGNPVDISVRKNTVIKVPGLVKVVINEHTPLKRRPYDGLAVRALHVIALPDAPEDIAGIDIELGVAAAWVRP
ncbi:hypothetical protein DJ010_03475 [Nocardioides silvaticus]|uniref:Peptidoglycan binding domain-containing protein n=1 Tax=Nocardioides silvaticus TaxID=2201891 RepID=A0A316TJA0_9ACTN|nr:choice-of-anchor P family protein [Nocardioides silvaticus]PWN04693.1 hypothetical protein DJ010_03475 [Nocardioides silvaticus]